MTVIVDHYEEKHLRSHTMLATQQMLHLLTEESQLAIAPCVGAIESAVYHLHLSPREHGDLWEGEAVVGTQIVVFIEQPVQTIETMFAHHGGAGCQVA